jgi:hypothetical protein
VFQGDLGVNGKSTAFFERTAASFCGRENNFAR